MGFDNECILNIQSLPGEYFCPVCRTLVYPNEALQTQCTHLYCKPCLTYIVATTCACPYDGYLVSEADAKPLIESNKPTAEAIEKIQVHCLYHRSGCQWQGTLSECITHCTTCNFGNSPVVCNRCGAQIIHRQVQEHAQICPGVQPQAQQADSAQTQAAVATQNQSVAQPAASTSQEPVAQPTAPASVAVASSTSVAAPSSVSATTAAVPTTAGQDQGQPSAAMQPQVTAQAPTTEQWYQQQPLQYQQYYQQYPGYDPYQQHYQQYGYYQQQAHAQYPQAYAQPVPVQGQQPQVYAQQQPQAQAQAHAQPPHTQVQAHGYPQPLPITQPHQAQVPSNLQQPVQAQPQQPQMHPSTQPQIPVQQLGQPQTQAHQLQPQPLLQAQPPHLPQLRPPHQQPMMVQHPPQIQQQQSHAQYQQQPNLYPHAQPAQQPPPQVHPQPHPRPHSLTQAQPQPQHQIQPQPQPVPQPQLQPHPQGQPQPQPQLHPGPAHAVTGHQSFPQANLHQQTPPAAATHQRPMHMHAPQQGVSHHQPTYPAQMQNQFQHQPPPQAQMRPQPSQVPVQGQQHAVIHSAQATHMHLLSGQQQTPHVVHPSGQQIHHPPGMQAPPQQPGISQQQPQGPPHLSQLHHQGSFPPQQPVHPQQGLRPQGHPYVHQHPQLQPPSQTAPRPVPVAPALPQQSPAQTLGGPGIRPHVSSDLKVASAQIVQTGNQGSALPLSPAILLPSMDEKREDSVSDKTVQAAVEIPTEKKGDVLTDLKDNESNFKHAVGEDKLSETTEVENGQSVADGEHRASFENDGVSEHKQNEKEVGTSELCQNRVPVDSSVERDGEEGAVPTENKKLDSKSDGPDDKSMHGHTQSGDHDVAAKPLATAENVTQHFASQGPMYGNERGNVQSQPRQQVPPSASLPYDASAPAHDRAFHPGYADRSMPQFPHHGPAPGDPRGFPLPQIHPNVAPPHAPPYMQDAMSQRPPAPDRMLPQHMPHPGPNQDRMFQEPPPRAMLIQGQPLIPNQMRLPPYNFPENLAHQGQLPIITDPLHAKHPPGNFPAPGSNAPLGRGPNSFGPPQGSQLPGQGQIPPPSNPAALGPRIPHAEPFSGPAPINARVPPVHLEGQMLRSHPPNPLEAGHFDGRQPDFQRSLPLEHFPRNQSNMSAMNGFPGKVPDLSLSQGPIGERFKPLPDERYKSMADEGQRPPADDRFRPYGADPSRRLTDRRDFEEDLKHFPRPSDLDSEAGSKLENYLSSSRPHLDRSSHGLDGTSRPFDRGFGPEGLPRIGGISPVPSRLMPGGHVPLAGSLHPMDAMERPRSFGLHDDNMGRKGDLPPDFHRPPSDFGRHRIDSLHPLRSPGSELSGLPSCRFGAFSRFEEFNREQHTFGERAKQHNPSPDSISLHDKILHGSGILPSHLRRGEKDTLRIGDLPGHMRGGNLDSHDIMPSHMRGDDPLSSGSFRSHLRLGELSRLENIPSHMRSRDFARFGEPGYGSSFPMHDFPNEAGAFGSGSFQGGLDPLDHPRKRKPGSVGWCRICKIDCETVEGLDLHSQTKEHQKMAMDIVLSIKQDSAKKHKLSSEEHEESNKSRKTGFEGRPSRR